MQSSTPHPLWKTAIRSGLAGFALTAVALGGIQLSAQSIASHNSRAPVNFDSGTFQLDDRQNRVTLSGGVVVKQAGLTVSSSRMLVNYSDSGSLDISRLTATGGVTVSRGNESAKGDVAIYDLNRRIITMAGNVRLQRAGDTLSGGRLVIDLVSGVSSIDGRSSGGSNAAPEEGAVRDTGTGRVRGSFSVPQN